MIAPSSNLGHFVTKRAHLNPDLEAIVDADTGRRFTFAELNTRINRTANASRASVCRRAIGSGC